MAQFNEIAEGDVLQCYESWQSPTVIISDGAYGLGMFPGEPKNIEGLLDWYRPHIEEWSKKALPSTTLWFWNTEIGWATVHPLLVENGWEYVHCVVWDKGMSHIAGNCNTQTLRNFPVVTELCVQYRRKVHVGSRHESLQSWLRTEWARSGLPYAHANIACGVANAATRKYLTPDHMWYFPPPHMFSKLEAYANKHGCETNKPYFALNGQRVTSEQWACMRGKFRGRTGLTNVWKIPPVSGPERLKEKGKSSHMNQKPEVIFRELIEATSDKNDVIWEPFGGTCTAAVAAYALGRSSHSCEINSVYHRIAQQRLTSNMT